MSATLQKPHNWSYAKTASGNCVTGEATMRTKSLNSEKMEARVARFNKLQTYQRQNFEAHGIPPGAVEKITARRVYPVMAPADYQGRSVGAPVKGPRGLTVSIGEGGRVMAGLHRHLNPVGNFFCRSGRFEITGAIRASTRSCWSRST